MLAVYATAPAPNDPLSALEVGERPDPVPAEGWTTVEVRAAGLNHHDLWTLRGVGIAADRFPMILGCDAAGVDTRTGEEVVVHAVVASPGWSGDETLDPARSLLSEKHQGTLARYVSVPARNVVRKPPELSFEDAACLPTAWLTAYRMLFTKAEARPGQTVLVQGASGGVASAAIALGRAAGLRVWATARTEAKRAAALRLGAHRAFEPGARLPERVDAVVETVGEATWAHSMKALRPGGRLVVSGATSGAAPPADLNRLFFLQLEVVGSTMGTRRELEDLMALLVHTGLRPAIDRTLPLAKAADGLAAMLAGEMVGKIVLIP
ncbi:zinc-binding dehydrogenase [Spongiactinospora sp. TRM90649]|uniref:zinc-binding dehydrogenase n=1 Tax=Spongiactinospora sp. TRM90649 TaxID=3031114 RepID=UPI0023F95413|nr:zinc-binding dehydrogenase [Spongiactinospora sp. TRM90649]MDF5754829.1 zinc-binding dehydrogenase [Spongiactinospora sp. TRM90649]